MKCALFYGSSGLLYRGMHCVAQGYTVRSRRVYLTNDIYIESILLTASTPMEQLTPGDVRAAMDFILAASIPHLLVGG